MQNNIEKSTVAVSSTQPNTSENVWFKKGKNLINKNEFITGYRFDQNGGLYEESGYLATDFIYVASNTNYVANWTLEVKQCICYYDANRTFISRNVLSSSFITPSNCKYIRASVESTKINTAQIEIGSTSTAYESYIEKEILVKNNSVFENFMNEIKYSSLILNSTYISDVDCNVITRYGKVCRVDFRGKVATAIPNNTTFATLPYPPATQVVIIGGIGGRYEISSPRWIYVTGGGEIRDGAIDANTYIHISFTYICK